MIVLNNILIIYTADKCMIIRMPFAMCAMNVFFKYRVKLFIE